MTAVIAPITHQQSATLPSTAKPAQIQPGDWSAPHLVDPVQLAAVMGIQIISVKALGAVGGGATDDSAALRMALSQAEANGGAVFVPPGVYMVSRETGTNACLKITGNNVILFGVKGQSVIKQIPQVASPDYSCVRAPGTGRRAGIGQEAPTTARRSAEAGSGPPTGARSLAT